MPPFGPVEPADGESPFNFGVQVQTWIWWPRLPLPTQQYSLDSFKRNFINEVARTTILEPAELADVEVAWSDPMRGERFQSAGSMIPMDDIWRYRRVTFKLRTSDARAVLEIQLLFSDTDTDEAGWANRWARLLGVEADEVVKGLSFRLRHAYLHPEQLPNPRGDGSLYGMDSGDVHYW